MLTLVVNLSVHFYLFHDILLGLITIGRSCTHALVEFVEEECTGVVPLKRINGNGGGFEAGDKVTVHWSNGKKYPAVFLLSDNVLAFNMCDVTVIKPGALRPAHAWFLKITCVFVCVHPRGHE